MYDSDQCRSKDRLAVKLAVGMADLRKESNPPLVAQLISTDKRKGNANQRQDASSDPLSRAFLELRPWRSDLSNLIWRDLNRPLEATIEDVIEDFMREHALVGSSTEDVKTSIRNLIQEAERVFLTGKAKLIRGLERILSVSDTLTELPEVVRPKFVVINGGKRKYPKPTTPAIMSLGPFAEPSNTENDQPPV